MSFGMLSGMAFRMSSVCSFKNMSRSRVVDKKDNDVKSTYIFMSCYCIMPLLLSCSRVNFGYYVILTLLVGLNFAVVAAAQWSLVSLGGCWWPDAPTVTDCRADCWVCLFPRCCCCWVKSAFLVYHGWLRIVWLRIVLLSVWFVWKYFHDNLFFFSVRPENGAGLLSVRPWGDCLGGQFRLGYRTEIQQVMIIIFTQPLRSGRIWHKVNF